MIRGPKIVETTRVLKERGGWKREITREEFWLHPTKGWRKGLRQKKIVPVKFGSVYPQETTTVTWAGK